MGRVRAAVCRAFGEPFAIEEVELRPPGPDEVEVAIETCAICHSDIAAADGAWGGHLPAVYGHEAAGRVVAVGPGAERFAKGDAALVTLLRACGACRSCATGHPAVCETPYDRAAGPLSLPDGGPVEQGLSTAAFAERAVVHKSQIAKIPEDMPMDAACLLSCGVITGVGAVVNTAGLRPGQTAVVIGAGGVGLNAIQGARIAGASRIVAVDMSAEKLEAAREFGATDATLATAETPWREVKKSLGGGADFVFVAVGAIPAYETAMRYLGRGGRMVMVGMPPDGAKAGYEPVIAAAIAQGMLGSKMGDAVLARDIPWMAEMYRQGRLKLDELISGRWPLERINEAIADSRGGAARRNVIVFA